MSDVDMLRTIEPKTDQLNFDSFGGGITKTIKITSVTGNEGEQPISIHYENEQGRPYKPGKSMRRVIVALWGINAKDYVGRSMTLYGDPDVIFGGVKVGGIRISHMSHITEPHVLALTNKKGSKKSFTVRPLVAQSLEPTINVDALKAEAVESADAGMDALKTFWTSLGAAKQKAIGGAEYLEELKTIAMKGTTDETAN